MAELLFGQAFVLVEAKFFLGSVGVSVSKEETVTYYHFMFDRHHIVETNGALSESFYPGAQALSVIDKGPYAELISMLPELARNDLASFGGKVAFCAKGYEADVLVQHLAQAA